jgi:Vitamin K-dependent gamma-carboxylase
VRDSVMSAPPERQAALRILVGGYAVGYLLVRAPHFWQVAALEQRRWEPVGLLGWLDHPLAPSAVRFALVAAILAGIGFVTGWRYRLLGPLFLVFLLLVTTVRNSWGQVWHTENLLLWHVGILAFAPAADAWSLDTRARRLRPTASPQYGSAVQLMSLATLATYAIAGLTKLRSGGIGWLTGDVLRHQVAFDNVRKAALGATSSPIVDAVLEHAWLFAPLAWFALAVELGAPFALVSPRSRCIWALAAWCFHVGVLLLMAISFPYQLSGIAYASLFPVERLGRRTLAEGYLVRSHLTPGKGSLD